MRLPNTLFAAIKRAELDSRVTDPIGSINLFTGVYSGVLWSHWQTSLQNDFHFLQVHYPCCLAVEAHMIVRRQRLER